MLRQIANRLKAYAPRKLPHHYQQEMDRVFGSDLEPETNRWER